MGPKGRLTVDAHYRTSVPHIYAAGDVIGFPALASTSMEQARVAMCHAFVRGYKTDLASLLPTGIYTIPEVSMVGSTEEDLKSKGLTMSSAVLHTASVPAARSSATRPGSSSCSSAART